MFRLYNYIYNIGSDIINGYIKVKCANPNCNKIFNISRNNYKGDNYSCNMGCSLEAYKHFNNNK